ncbi:MAG TPA: tetratricopeptide repeat protein [Cellvibrionaceae bacterium]
MSKILSLLSVALFIAGTAQAQVQVVDSSPQRAASESTSTTQQVETYYQLQILQQEVMELRGLVEEQAHELSRLKQQRMDDYLDLDRRVSALTRGGNTGTTTGALPAPTSSIAPSAMDNNPNPLAATASSISTDASESDIYSSAYELLRQRKIDQSIEAFKSHLQAYPRGEYAGNSYYWLGEIYLLKDDLSSAEQWFGDLLREFPESRKVHDAQFKLGRVYHLQGQNDRARELLSIVAASSSDASRLAKQYLAENF